MDSLLMRYSALIKGIFEDEKSDDDIKLIGIDGESFEYIIKFMDLHKDKESEPMKITYPIKTNQDIKLIMEEQDAELVLRILNKPDNLALFKKVLDGTSYLQMEDFKKRLLAGLTVKLLKFTVEELKEELNIKEADINED